MHELMNSNGRSLLLLNIMQAGSKNVAYVSVARIHLQVITIHVIIMTLTHLTQGHTNGKTCDKNSNLCCPRLFCAAKLIRIYHSICELGVCFVIKKFYTLLGGKDDCNAFFDCGSK